MDEGAARRKVADDELQSAWGSIVERYAEQAWAVARRQCSSSREAAEVCQLVWLRLEQNVRCHGLPSDPAAWLTGAVLTAAEDDLGPSTRAGRGFADTRPEEIDREA